MAEGYQCDRCRKTREGAPDTTLGVGEGLSRSRPSLSKNKFRENVTPNVWDFDADLCQSCRNDLCAWWAGGGGDASDIRRTDESSDETPESE